MPSDDRAISSLTRQNEPNQPPGKSYLLAIGINEYAAFSKLKNAVKDVRDVAALLADRFGFERQQPFTRFLLDGEATRRNIINSLENLCDLLQPDDRALLFYSGHGYLHPRTKHGFWIPADAEKDDVSTYLPNTTLRDYVKAMPCRHILLVSDSCFSGELLVRDASRGADGAFSEWEKQRSRWVFCSGKGVVGDGEAGKNSPFAAEFLRSLRQHVTAEPLNAARLADQVTRQVSYNYEQQAEACPLFGVGHEGGQFIFYPQKKEAEEWQAALATGTSVAFEDFLKNHPASQFAAEARQRIAELEKAERLRLEQAAHDEEYRLAKEGGESWKFFDFLVHWPQSPHRQEMRELLRQAEDEEAWSRVKKNSLADLTDYLEDKPEGKYAADARNRLAELKAAHKEKEAARRREEEARRQSEAEKQAVADLAARQRQEEDEKLRKLEMEEIAARQRRLREAEQARQQQDEELWKQKDEARRVWEAEAARQQRVAVVLKQQQEYARLRLAVFSFVGDVAVKHVFYNAPHSVVVLFGWLSGDDLDQFYKVHKKDSGILHAIPAYMVGILMYYSGQLVAKAFEENPLLATSVNKVEFFPFGKSGRIFNWLDFFSGKHEALQYYNECFKAGFSPQKGAPVIELVKKDEAWEDNKSEVAKGSVDLLHVTIAKNILQHSDIFGEAGYLFLQKRKRSPIAKLDYVRSVYFQDFEFTLILPKNFVEFSKFLNLFLRFAKEQGILNNTSVFKSKLDDMYNVLKGYICNYPEFLIAQSNKRKNPEEEFEFRQSMLILEGMCYLEKFLIPEIFIKS